MTYIGQCPRVCGEQVSWLVRRPRIWTIPTRAGRTNLSEIDDPNQVLSKRFLKRQHAPHSLGVADDFRCTSTNPIICRSHSRSFPSWWEFSSFWLSCFRSEHTQSTRENRYAAPGQGSIGHGLDRRLGSKDFFSVRQAARLKLWTLPGGKVK